MTTRVTQSLTRYGCGHLDAQGGTIIIAASALPDIFRAAINLDGLITATRLEEKDGVLRIVAEGDVVIKNKIQVLGSISELYPTPFLPPYSIAR